MENVELGNVSAKEKLAFHDGKFRIVQFTDLHWSHNSPNCAQTAATIRAVLQAEKPDVAILTGDVVTDAPAAEGWKAIAALFEEAAIPFAVTMGNHDAEASITKAEIYEILAASPHFVGEKGPEYIKGCGNYVLPVYDSKGKGTVAALLYCLDSNDYPSASKYGHYDWIHYDQIDWYRRQSLNYTRANGGKPLPALAFFHIPILEYYNVVGKNTTIGNKEEGIASPLINTGFFSSLIDRQDIMGVFTGHDHDNDYIGIEQDVALAFGRVTGADAYGKFERGARVIDLYEDKFKFDSWIRTPSGTELTYYFPSGLSSIDEENMEYLPAKPVEPRKQGVAYTYYEGKFKHTDQMRSGVKVKEGTMPNISITGAPAEDHFGYEFRAWIRIPERGVYRFYTFSDDGSRLLIDGNVVVDNDGSHNSRRKDGKVALEAGFHELKVLYFEDYMGQVLEVGVSSRDIRETTLPDYFLYLPEKE
ncbi:PA14 domain-containing protein [Parabacteroides sp. PF5-6]|uniref:PA14 domain-containing protein n=1 Tax=Parabacteroides sp. PF5-6 TaxID=1742403 RepID=UPI002406B046|nr:PA14 domain-containing protein [Parabacteroides sp. PF5-6]